MLDLYESIMSDIIGQVIKVAAIVGIGLGVDSLMHYRKAKRGAGMKSALWNQTERRALTRFRMPSTK